EFFRHPLLAAGILRRDRGTTDQFAGVFKDAAHGVLSSKDQLCLCSSSFSSMALLLVTHCTAPVSELRRNSRSFWPASSRAFTFSTTAPVSSSTSTLVPAVMYRPDSMVQRSPSGMPVPALAPSRQPSPSEITILPPPDRVPMVEAPPPMSEPLPTNTPAEMRPSIMPG